MTEVEQSNNTGCGVFIAILVIVFFIGQCNDRMKRQAYDRGYQDRAFNEYNPDPPQSYNSDW